MLLSPFERSGASYGLRNNNIVDPALEQLDPTPNLHELFRQFNIRFFWAKLDMVEVSWSGGRMTTCAGVCSFSPNSGHCHIRLSAQLLPLRPRKDLVETLLHEMIHAFLFITRNTRDRSDHGPEFHKHMYRINNDAGTNITVYHTFNDEVRHFQNHIWRCNGPCHKVGPFYGFLRRATNRAPGPNDKWWDRHKFQCNGEFVKIKEPVGYKSKKKGNISEPPTKKPAGSIRDCFTPRQFPTSNIHSFTDITNKKPTGGDLSHSGSSVMTPVKAYPKKVDPPITKGGGHHNKILAGSVSKTKPPLPTAGLNKRGTNISSPTFPKRPKIIPSNSRASSSSVNETVRNVWASKFPPKGKIPKNLSSVIQCDTCDEFIDEGDATHRCSVVTKPCPICNMPVHDGKLDDHLNVCLSDSITEDMFASDDEPKREQILSCPVCNLSIDDGKLEEHLNECLSDTEDMVATVHEPKRNQILSCPVCSLSFDDGKLEEHLSECLSDTEDMFVTDVPKTEQMVSCPICGCSVLEAVINEHIDSCISPDFNDEF